MSSLDKLVAAVKGGDRDEALTACDAVLGEGVEAQWIIDALTEGMRDVGRSVRADRDLFARP